MNIFSYHGRIGRVKYLLGIILLSIASAIVGFLLSMFSVSLLISNAKNLGAMFMLVIILDIIVCVTLFITSLFLVMKRFHDIGKSGKWWFALLIPIYNIHLTISLLTERGIVGPNPYGNDTLPPNTSDDIFNRFAQNKVARIVTDILIVGLLLLGPLVIAMLSLRNFGVNNIGAQLPITQKQALQQTKDDLMRQTLQLAANGDMATSSWNKYTYKALPSDNFNSFSFSYPSYYYDGSDNVGGIHVISLPSIPHEFIVSDSSNTMLGIDVLIAPLSGQLMNGVKEPNITKPIENIELPNGLKGQTLEYRPEITGGENGPALSMPVYRIVIPLSPKNKNEPQIAVRFDLIQVWHKVLLDSIVKTIISQ